MGSVIRSHQGKLPYRKLKPGPGRSAAEVVADQRARLIGAMVELVAERGLGDVTVRGLAGTAGVSTRTFYSLFPNAEECFTATYGSLMRAALKRFRSPRRSSPDWEKALRAGLTSLLEEIAEHPTAGRLALVESFDAGPAMLREMSGATRDFERFVVDSFAAAPGRVAVPVPVLQALAAGVEHVLRVKILAGREAELPGVTEELADWALAMRDPAVARLPIPGPLGAANGKRVECGSLERELGAAEFGAAGSERARILAAVVRLSARDGYWNLTIPKIRREAGVSRRSFDTRFQDVGDCYLQGVAALTSTAMARARRKAAGAADWEQWVCRLTNAFCVEVARSPALAQLGFIDVFAPGKEGLQCREEMLAAGAEVVRGIAPRDRRPSELEIEASIAAGWRIIHSEIVAGRARKLSRVAPLIAYVILAPAVGARRATEAIGAAEQQRGLAAAFKEGERAHAVR
jgi:AcrR family transcriptional regulator